MTRAIFYHGLCRILLEQALINERKSAKLQFDKDGILPIPQMQAIPAQHLVITFLPQAHVKREWLRMKRRECEMWQNMIGV
mmetsp:Transcript_31961/g.62876  ORF Transcript_31961/g.62876 Transcript_31961/m.62876 type:complete len:81 (-) Transcript_31961:1288-1530(-)